MTSSDDRRHPVDDGMLAVIVRLADSILFSESNGEHLEKMQPGYGASADEIREWATSVAKSSMEALGELGVTEFPADVDGPLRTLLSESVRLPLGDNVNHLLRLLREVRLGGVHTLERIAVLSTTVVYQSDVEDGWHGPVGLRT